MRLIGQNANRRKVYAEKLGDDDFAMFAHPEAQVRRHEHGGHSLWRPYQRFNSQQELEREAMSRNHEVIWLAP